MGGVDDDIQALQDARKAGDGTALGAKATGEFDNDLYDGGGLKGYSRELADEPVMDDEVS